jgi:hypothetical protein
MAYELLKKIAEGELPMTLTAQVEIEDVRVLRDAGYVKAEISPSEDSPAVVTALTPLGRTAIRYFASK